MRSVLISEVRYKMQHVHTFHDVLRIFYGYEDNADSWTNDEVESAFMLHQRPRMAHTMATGPSFGGLPLSEGRALANLMLGDAPCEKCEVIPGLSRSHKRRLRNRQKKQRREQRNRERKRLRKNRNKKKKPKHKKKKKKGKGQKGRTDVPRMDSARVTCSILNVALSSMVPLSALWFGSDQSRAQGFLSWLYGFRCPTTFRTITYYFRSCTYLRALKLCKSPTV